MTRDEITRMAQEAGGRIEHIGIDIAWFEFMTESLERFAALVAAAERERIADESKHIIKRAEARGAEVEREACAKVCESERERLHEFGYGLQVLTADKLAVAIQARGKK
jgi:hypothetical protein